MWYTFPVVGVLGVLGGISGVVPLRRFVGMLWARVMADEWIMDYHSLISPPPVG